MPAHPEHTAAQGAASHGNAAPVLSDALTRLLPDCKLYVQQLPDVAELRLLLLDGDGMRRPLAADVVQSAMENPLYWIFCWASGQVLARYVLDHPHLVRGRRVVDFGCGSGVVAIAAAMAGAGEVIACDTDSFARAAAAHNAQLNEVSVSLNADFDAIEGSVDLILASDVLYDHANLRWLGRFTARAETVLVADSRLSNFCWSPYQRIAQIESSTVPDLDESREFNCVTLYRADTGQVSSGAA